MKVIGECIDVLLEGVIRLVRLLVEVTKSLRNGILLFLSLGGCLAFFLLPTLLAASGSYGGTTLRWLLLIFVFPLLGTVSTTYLEYLQFSWTEYFYERADKALIGEHVTYESLGDYGFRKARLAREEAKRRAQEEAWAREEARRRAQEQFFEDFARQFQQGGFYTFDGTGWHQQGGGSSYGGPQSGMGPSSFVRQYEAACEELGVSPQADKYEIKMAFRQLAKKYHPDVNHEAGAKERFQRINSAYEFLTDDAIARYRRESGQ